MACTQSSGKFSVFIVLCLRMSIQFSIFLILFLQYCAASKESNAVLHFSSSLEAARRVLVESGIPPLQSPLSSPPLASRRPPLPPLPHLPLPSAPPPLPSARVGKLYPSTFVLLLPISAVAFVFICTFIWSRNLRSDSAEAASSNLWSLSSPNALVPALASQIHGNNTTFYNLGLDLCLLNKLPTFLLPAMKTRSLKDNQKIRRKDYYTCAVCICDYEEGETLKLLPACGHSFHKDCIDIWLFSHSTCPLCRLSLFNSKGDLILLEEEQELEYNSVVDDQYSHLATTDLEIHEPGNTSTQPLVDNHILISPLIRMFRRTQSCITSSQADQAAHSGAGGALNFLRRSCSQPAREHKVHPVQSFS